MKLVEINELFEEVKEKSIEVVSGHGFCLFIKRTLINEIGGFNEKEFARIRGGK
jgi:GT2 family glycosyltransferase